MALPENDSPEESKLLKRLGYNPDRKQTLSEKVKLHDVRRRDRVVTPKINELMDHVRRTPGALGLIVEDKGDTGGTVSTDEVSLADANIIETCEPTLNADSITALSRTARRKIAENSSAYVWDIRPGDTRSANRAIRRSDTREYAVAEVVLDQLKARLATEVVDQFKQGNPRVNIAVTELENLNGKHIASLACLPDREDLGVHWFADEIYPLFGEELFEYGRELLQSDETLKGSRFNIDYSNNSVCFSVIYSTDAKDKLRVAGI